VIAQVIDPRELELTAKVSELDRANIKVGQAADIEFDALPGKIFHGSIKSAAGAVQRQFFWDSNSGTKYDVSIQLTDADPHLRPGLTAQVTILGDSKANVLYVPRQALFLKDGKQVVFLNRAGTFEQLPVTVDFENESHAAIEGLKEGDAVAFTDPTTPKKGASPATSATLGGGKL
jgi:hypothetical protein